MTHQKLTFVDFFFYFHPNNYSHLCFPFSLALCYIGVTWCYRWLTFSRHTPSYTHAHNLPFQFCIFEWVAPLVIIFQSPIPSSWVLPEIISHSGSSKLINKYLAQQLAYTKYSPKSGCFLLCTLVNEQIKSQELPNLSLSSTVSVTRQHGATNESGTQDLGLNSKVWDLI